MSPKCPYVFDVIILGAGPAGMTAAIYAARRRMKALLICGKVGGQMMWSSDIENYTGTAQATGPELTKQFYEHIQKVDDDNASYDLWVREKEKVKKIKKEKDIFQVITDKKRTYRSRTIVVATGKIPKTLSVPGEKVAMAGNGLSFCATCDAPLYRNKKMAIIGGGNSAMDVGIQLLKITDSITIFVNTNHLIGETVLMEKILKHPKITVKYNAYVQEILLNKKKKVRGVSYMQEGKQKEFLCEGIFEEIGQKPATEFLDGFLTLNAGREIPTNRRCHTKAKGVFAAGDCSDRPHTQVSDAAGEGAIAALEAHDF